MRNLGRCGVNRLINNENLCVYTARSKYLCTIIFAYSICGIDCQNDQLRFLLVFAVISGKLLLLFDLCHVEIIRIFFLTAYNKYLLRKYTISMHFAMISMPFHVALKLMPLSAQVAQIN